MSFIMFFNFKTLLLIGLMGYVVLLFAIYNTKLPSNLNNMSDKYIKRLVGYAVKNETQDYKLASFHNEQMTNNVFKNNTDKSLTQKNNKKPNRTIKKLENINSFEDSDLKNSSNNEESYEIPQIASPKIRNRTNTETPQRSMFTSSNTDLIVTTKSQNESFDILENAIPKSSRKLNKGLIFSPSDNYKKSNNRNNETKANDLSSKSSVNIQNSETIEINDVIRKYGSKTYDPIPPMNMRQIYDKLLKLYPMIERYEKDEQVVVISDPEGQPSIHVVIDIKTYPPKISFLKNEFSQNRIPYLLDYLKATCKNLEKKYQKSK